MPASVQRIPQLKQDTVLDAETVLGDNDDVLCACECGSAAFRCQWSVVPERPRNRIQWAPSGFSGSGTISELLEGGASVRERRC